MAFFIYTPPGCGVSIPDHFATDCPEVEQGRIRSFGYIANDFAITDPTNPTQWNAGILAKKIVVIPNSSGTFDGGSEVESTGYGDQATKVTGYNFTLTANDPNYINNHDFWNQIKRSNNYRLFYRTETKIHITRNAVSIIPKAPVADDISSSVVWTVLHKWSDEDQPVAYDTPPGVFRVYDYTGGYTAAY